MNYYWANNKYSYYEKFSLYKSSKVFKFKIFFINSVFNKWISYLYNYELLWKNAFKPTFSTNKRKLKKYLIPSKYGYLNFTINKNLFIFLSFLKQNFLVFFFYNKASFAIYDLLFSNLIFNFNPKQITIKLLKLYKKISREGFIYIRGLFVIFFLDASFTDDEPLWEPLEWSLVQTWILFIFIFAWIAENLINSRYGNYTGRDKRVWFGWYKTFWLIEIWYLLSYGTAAAFVIVPFYWELTYNISIVFSWWNWYTRIFFFKFISLYSIILFLSFILLINVRWFNWKKTFFFTLVINFFLTYLLYTHFIMCFFGYFTDPIWYQKTRHIDYIQLSHEPLKWGWGPAKKDHFTYHRTSSVFWFKNDGPFAGAFLMTHLFLFFTIFFIYVYWLSLLRKIYTTKEVTFTFVTFCVSALRQFLIFFLFLYIFVFLSLIINYWRFPIEFLWITESRSWLYNFLIICLDYYQFLLTIF